ncbi:MAG: glycogen(starch) synthase [Paracoccaceae bacterium]
MNILYWTERFWPHIGGVEVLSLELVPELSKLNYDVNVVTSHSAAKLPNADSINGIQITRFDFLTSLSNKDLATILSARKRLSDFKRKTQPDLIHIHFSGPSALFHWQTEQAFHAPTLVTIHSLPPSFVNDGISENSLLISTLRKADWVNTVSAAKLNDIRKVLPELAEKSSLIYNGRSMPDTVPSELPMESPTLLCLGRLVRWKGFDIAIDAFSQVANQYPSMTLKIAGDGPELDRLKQQVETLGLQHSVLFTGWIEPEKIPDLLNQVTAVLLPSREEETLPVVALQAAQMARPIIASNLAGFPEVIENNLTGLLFEAGSASALATAIRKTIDSPVEARLMGINAREQAAKRFGLDYWVNQYDKLYKRLIHEFKQAKDNEQ